MFDDNYQQAFEDALDTIIDNWEDYAIELEIWDGEDATRKEIEVRFSRWYNLMLGNKPTEAKTHLSEIHDKLVVKLYEEADRLCADRVEEEREEYGVTLRDEY
jgi:hypothetical protein